MSAIKLNTTQTSHPGFSTQDHVQVVVERKAGKSKAPPPDVFVKSVTPATATTPPTVVLSIVDAAPAQKADGVKKTWFSAPARMFAKISKPVTRFFGKVMAFGGGTLGTAATAAMVTRHVAPSVVRPLLDKAGLLGQVGPQSASLLMAGIALAATVFTIAVGSSFMRAGKATKSEG